MCLLTVGNSWVFGNDHLQDDMPPQDNQSSVACLAAQRAACKKAAASESQPAAQDPEPATQESDPEVQESDGGEAKDAPDQHN